MIDGLRFSNCGETAVNRLRKSGVLKLRTKEVTNHKGLTVVIEQERYNVSGSIHKYFNDGLHNADDFTIDNYREAIIRLSQEFQINPETIPFTSMEFGINIVLPCDVKKFLQSIVIYRDCSTTKYRGDSTKKGIIINKYGGLEVGLSDYTIKIYDKSGQYPKYTLPNTLRFEIAIKRKRRIRKRIIITDFHVGSQP